MKNVAKNQGYKHPQMMQYYVQHPCSRTFFTRWKKT